MTDQALTRYRDVLTMVATGWSEERTALELGCPIELVKLIMLAAGRHPAVALPSKIPRCANCWREIDPPGRFCSNTCYAAAHRAAHRAAALA